MTGFIKMVSIICDLASPLQLIVLHVDVISYLQYLHKIKGGEVSFSNSLIIHQV